MDLPLPPLHHSLILNARSDSLGHEGEIAWSMEFTVFRSKNGFQSHAEWVGILERRGKNASELERKVIRKILPFPNGLSSPESLFEQPWTCDSIEFTGKTYRGIISSAEGDLSWSFDLDSGHSIEFFPLSRWLNFRTSRTQIPIQGNWKLLNRKTNTEDLGWSSSGTPARATLHFRDDSRRIWPTLWFHSQALRDTAASVEYCAEGLHAEPLRGLLPRLTCISAFEKLKGSPEASIWQALRSSMTKIPQGWSIKTELDGLELRGKIEVEPKHWITLRHEDVRGTTFYRSSTRMARLEILVLDNGKPQGFFSTGLDSWLEWTTFQRPVEIAEFR